MGAGGVRNPVVLECDSCDDVRWEDVSVDQGGHWATHPVYCSNLNIKNIKIVGQRDGIDVDSCKGVHIDGCTISTGDDSISLKSGRGMDGARLARPCEDITITNCDLTDRTFACLGIGSETSGGIKNVHMEHCKLNAPGRSGAAIYIKTRIGRGWGIENVSVDDCDITAKMGIRINMTAGGNASTADDTVEGLVGYPFGRNFSFTNIRANDHPAVAAGYYGLCIQAGGRPHCHQHHRYGRSGHYSGQYQRREPQRYQNHRLHRRPYRLCQRHRNGAGRRPGH